MAAKDGETKEKGSRKGQPICLFITEELCRILRYQRLKDVGARFPSCHGGGEEEERNMSGDNGWDQLWWR